MEEESRKVAEAEERERKRLKEVEEERIKGTGGVDCIVYDLDVYILFTLPYAFYPQMS